MAGVKGKSGRKPKWYEQKYQILEGLCVDLAIAIMKDQTEESDSKMKNRVMLEVIGKGLPQRMKHLTEDEDGNTTGFSVIAYLPERKKEDA